MLLFQALHYKLQTTNLLTNKFLQKAVPLNFSSSSAVTGGVLNDARSHVMVACGLFSPQFNLLFDNPIKLCLCSGELSEQKRSYKSENWKCIRMTKSFNKNSIK